MDEIFEPKEIVQDDFISVEVLNRMSLTLDYDMRFEPGAVVPKLWHWLFFLPQVKASDTGADGHPKTGGFIPALQGLDRRMWAGSRFWFHADLRAGQQAERKSVVRKVTRKEGKTGKLGFVLVEHQLSQNGRLVLTEEHDIVYKQAPTSPVTVASVNAGLKRPEKAAQWSDTIQPNPVLLFRYSALTFNAHRIHYDRDYCREEFGFPGLAVHGPLIATLLIELVRKNLPSSRVIEYSFRAQGPIFDFQTFKVEGCRDDAQVFLWAVNPDGLEAMTARASLETEKTRSEKENE
ncbi:MAG: MaoC family dehydratase N-terminal domain-containing protein [Hyphomicrobiales bacterium]